MSNRHSQTVFQSLTVQVPCAFGDGLHPITVVVDIEGALLGVRTGCDLLDLEYEETARALAPDSFTCCLDIKRDLIRVARAEMRLWDSEGAFEHLGGPSLIQPIARYIWIGSDTRRRRRQAIADRMNLDSPLGGALQNLEAVFRAYLKSPYLVLSAPTRGRHMALCRKGGGKVATYHGRGIWQVDFEGVENLAEDMSRQGTCELCGLKSSRPHIMGKRHKARVLDRAMAAMAVVGKRLGYRHV